MLQNGEKLHTFVTEFFNKDERMRFLGNIEAKIDSKGRAFLPAVFRKVLQSSGEENLVLRKEILRQFVSEAEIVSLDGNGRFLISKRLQRAAGLEQDLRFIGVDDTIEIWSPQHLEEILKSDEEFGADLINIMNTDDDR